MWDWSGGEWRNPTSAAAWDLLVRMTRVEGMRSPVTQPPVQNVLEWEQEELRRSRSMGKTVAE
jgi:hypothetical protein